MAGSLNRATIIGNLGNDPEIRNLPNGGKVANLSVATSESWKDKQTGEKKESTEWHRVSVFSEGLVRVVEQYLKKGMTVLIEGQIKTRKWKDQSGADKYSTEIVLQGFDAKLLMLGGKGGGGSSDSREPERQKEAHSTERVGIDPNDSDIPF